jgi:glycine/D-amino acid oxidase-like deaminating enzyme
MQDSSIIIGGGLYGCMIALLCAERGYQVTLIERDKILLNRASYNNQARVHGGYHYPRNRVTGIRSKFNMPRFEREFGIAMSIPRNMLYAIARYGSKVTPIQFERFCEDIGTPLSRVNPQQASLFDSSQVQAAYVVNEPVFDAALMRESLSRRLHSAGVKVILGTEALHINDDNGRPSVAITSPRQSGQHLLHANRVFNCTYSALGFLRVMGKRLNTRLKHEITEMALIKMPDELEMTAITVMDGDFWSSLPFPDRQMHTLSHVGYTPHASWEDSPEVDPYKTLIGFKAKQRSNGQKMLLDAARFVPLMKAAKQVDSLWEVKTVLVKNENDDGRPILLEKHPTMPVWNVLGGKVDNVFDLLDQIGTIISNPSDNLKTAVLA